MTKVAFGFLAMASIASCRQGEEEGGILSKEGEEVEADSTTKFAFSDFMSGIDAAVSSREMLNVATCFDRKMRHF